MVRKVIPYEILRNASAITLDLIERIVTENEQIAMRSFLRHSIHVLDDIIQNAGDKPIIGYHFAFPGDLLQCFDATLVCFEVVPYLMASLMPNGAEYFYDRITAFGHPFHSCTSQKGIMGMALDGLVDLDLAICPTGPCDNTIASYQFFSNQMKIPVFIADFPHYKNERAYKYAAEELVRQIDEIGKLIGQEPDYARLRTALNHSREAQAYLAEINEMRRATPCPIESIVNPLITGAITMMPGRPEKTQFFKEVSDLMKKRIKNHEGRGGEEKFRSFWPNISQFYDMGFYEWMDRELGMTQLVDVFTYLFFEPIQDPMHDSVESIFQQIAKQALNYPMTHQAQSFIETMVEDTLWGVKAFKADCAIMTGHLGCKQIASAIQIIREELRDRLSIPMLTIEVDIGDKRFNSIDAVKYEIAEFAKTLL
ncbi:MAG: 2-hydroxyacyl-CoA dehydratase family protein [Candidatus Helarchaeota archaeon]|nr:2-hydroxyacyl-CoA dehydratase family protein [Candidatus Helarchaeota archaeon]